MDTHVYQAIFTKYHAPTERRGPRISATSASGLRAFVKIDPEDSDLASHRKAALALCEGLHGWDGTRLIPGGTRNGYVFVFAPEAEEEPAPRFKGWHPPLVYRACGDPLYRGSSNG